MAFMMSLYFKRTKTMNPKELANAYARGGNITALLKDLSKVDYIMGIVEAWWNVLNR
jgi:hypothetical protein